MIMNIYAILILISSCIAIGALTILLIFLIIDYIKICVEEWKNDKR